MKPKKKKSRVRVKFRFHPDGLPLKEPVLMGSWDREGRFHEHWSAPSRPLQEELDGAWSAELELLAEPGQAFWWGVKERGNWLFFTQAAQRFVPSESAAVSFSLGHRHKLGLHPTVGGGFRAGLWAPRAREVSLVVGSARWVMQRQDEHWFAQSPSGWSEILGQPYHFELLTSEGDRVVRVDPYARRRQGPQRGVSDLFVTGSGVQTHRYARCENGHHLLRFEALGSKKRRAPQLEFLHQGEVLGKHALEARLLNKVALPKGELWWNDALGPDGRVTMGWQPAAKGYSVVVGTAEQLQGLEYRFVGNPRQVADWSDPWSGLLEGRHNWSRLGIVSEHLEQHHPLVETAEETIIYEMHVGSILGSGGNLRTSTFEQVAQKLEAIKELGFTAIALMPTNPTEGHRDWGYLGTCSMAHHESLAERGSFAEESLIEFVATAHRLGLQVFTDVVYNHVGGDHNEWWEFDGRSNPYFEWDPKIKVPEDHPALPRFPSDTAEAKPVTEDSTVKNTPWGPIPAYCREAVFQFYVDHAMDQIQRIGFDGIRFDFTNYIHAPESGGCHGWRLLREINQRLGHFFPRARTFAEEFPPAPVITRSTHEGGAGFDAMWNTEHQHRLIFHNHGPAVTTALVAGKEPPLSHFLEHLLVPTGFSEPSKSATVLSNHDEVGNASRLANIVAAHPKGRDIARLVCWVSLLSPGYPILFQGTEDLAENYFSWGLPNTWDLNSHLRGKRLPKHRTQHLAAIADVLRFRRDHSELHAAVPIVEYFLTDRLMGFRRGRYWIVANFCDGKKALPPLDVASKPVLNSESRRYGCGSPATRGRRLGPYACKLFELH